MMAPTNVLTTGKVQINVGPNSCLTKQKFDQNYFDTFYTFPLTLILSQMAGGGA